MAQRSSFTIIQAFSTSQNVSVKIALSLFDHQSEPILLYGCPTLREESSRTNVILQFKLLAAILSAVCGVI